MRSPVVYILLGLMMALCTHATLVGPDSVLCTLIKDEAPFVREWVTFHLLMGFTKIVVFSDMSDDYSQLLSELQPFGQSVEVRNASSVTSGGDESEHVQINRQVQVHRHCAQLYKDAAMYGFIDVDELVFPCRRQPGNALIQLFRELTSGAPNTAVKLDCYRFGMAGQGMHPVTRHQTKRAPHPSAEPDAYELLSKSIATCSITSRCEGPGSFKHLYDVSHTSGLAQAELSVHGSSLKSVSGSPDRSYGICCNHYAMSRNMTEKGLKNRNHEYVARAADPDAPRWYNAIFDGLIWQHLTPLESAMHAMTHSGWSYQQWLAAVAHARHQNNSTLNGQHSYGN